MNHDRLKQSLNELIQMICTVHKDTSKSEILTWLKAAALKIWSTNHLTAPSYGDALRIFEDKHYTTAQITTALECAGEEGRCLSTPKFFLSIVARDAEQNTTASRFIIDGIAAFLSEIALVNGDFTLREAACLNEITEQLGATCDREGIDRPLHTYSLPAVTPLAADGYYSEKKEPSAEQSVTPKAISPPAPENQETSSGIPIHVDIKIAPPRQEIAAQYSPEDAEEQLPEIKTADHETLESVLAELNSLVGLEKVKSDVQSLMNFIRICQLRKQRGMKVATMSYHLVFTGNPGTGKTTIARLIAKLYYLMGILPQGQLVETDRSGLVAGYLGQTAIKTQKVIQQALGGVLFIDEAYSLANDEKDMYGMEAIETILKAMEDHRDELIVIVAGYDELMHKFIDSNPGLRSRFNKYFHFPDYTGEEMLRILQRFCDTNGYALHPDAIPFLQEKLENAYINRDAHFGNARYIRNVFEHTINRQADRLAADPCITDEELMFLTRSDIESAWEAVS